MPGNYPEESIQHSGHGESLKSRILFVSLLSTEKCKTPQDGANKQQLSLLLWCGILPLMLHNSTAYYISLSLLYFGVMAILCICLICWGSEFRSLSTEQNISISMLEKGILYLSSSSLSSPL
jgi:hypothetical protein